MHRRHGARLALHDLQVHQDLTRAFLSVAAAKLVAFQIHEAHILLFHEAFRHQRRRAKRNVFADANGNVASVSVHIGALPQAAADIANLRLELTNCRRVKKGIDFPFFTFRSDWICSGKRLGPV